MQGIDPQRLVYAWLARLLALATLASGILAAGCGGSPSGSTAATLAGSSAPKSSSGHSSASAAGSSATVQRAGGSPALALARCMRANGVPNFPDPAPGGGFEFPVQGLFDPSSPAVQAAQAKCQKFMPFGAGSGAPAPSAQTIAKLLKIAQCMRRHGISEFPDPTTRRPSFRPGIGEITNYDGVYLAFPATLNLQSPAYKQALTACGAPPLGLPH